MSKGTGSIIEKKIHPLKQALGLAIAVLLVLTIIKITQKSGPESASLYWEVAACSILFYAMMNSIMSLAYEDQNFYWLYSIMGFAFLLISSLGLSLLYSGVTIDEAGSFRWILLVFTFGYLILLTIFRTMKKVVAFGKREDSRLRGGK